MSKLLRELKGIRIGKQIAETTADGRTVVDPRKLLADKDVLAVVRRMAESAKREKASRSVSSSE